MILFHLLFHYSLLQDIEYSSTVPTLPYVLVYFIYSHVYVNTKFQQRDLIKQIYEGIVEIFLAKPTAREGKLAEESPGRGN